MKRAGIRRAADVLSAVPDLRESAEDLLRRFVRSHNGTAFADLRFEAVLSRSSSAVDGEPRENTETRGGSLGLSVWFVGPDGAFGMGQVGAEIAEGHDGRDGLLRAISEGLTRAYERAKVSAREKAALAARLGGRAKALSVLTPPAIAQARDQVPALFQRDPRTVQPAEIARLSRETSAAIAGLGSGIAFNALRVLTEFRHELFLDSEGSAISQEFAFSQADCYVVAEAAGGHQEIFDTIGQQRGLECLTHAVADGLMPNPSLEAFGVGLGREALELAAAPVLKPPSREVTVVTDPGFNALLAHEIVGHPSEADRALKMEAAYAGRSWLLATLERNEVGRQIGSPLLSACSDPLIDGYGHYRYDHEGTPGRRVTHIENGIFRGFLNSRATAAVLGVEPNGSARASAACYVPLIRMSNTFFMAGATPPEEIIAEVDHGYYVCGSQVPSIAESRENFRISARKVYEIDHGRLGRLYRAGSVMADSRRFFLNVDAVGNDLRLAAIPNCGKGQPMQVKRMSNGGPTLRSRAFLRGG
jgi:TldD protein